MQRKFQRTIEDFVCENCGEEVKGTGYTNHCPACLWSKHVDINPGDRENSCQGLMKPIDAYFKSQEWYLNQECQKCNAINVIKVLPEDNQEIIQKILDKKAKEI
jgi:Zn finger protein HypA/HybF involved in hydrogenase expression